MGYEFSSIVSAIHRFLLEKNITAKMRQNLGLLDAKRVK